MKTSNAIIYEFCTVIEETENGDIYYVEDGEGYATVNGEEYSCSSREAFHDLITMLY